MSSLLNFAYHACAAFVGGWGVVYFSARALGRVAAERIAGGRCPMCEQHIPGHDE